MAATITKCPNCRFTTTRHCDSRTCTWWVCRRCRLYGDAKRAASFPGQRAK